MQQHEVQWSFVVGFGLEHLDYHLQQLKNPFYGSMRPSARADDTGDPGDGPAGGPAVVLLRGKDGKKVGAVLKDRKPARMIILKDFIYICFWLL